MRTHRFLQRFATLIAALSLGLSGCAAMGTMAAKPTIPPLGFTTDGPSTIGMTFREGDIPRFAAITSDGKPAPAQIDPLVRWADGSLKFARITVAHQGEYLLAPSAEQPPEARVRHTPIRPPNFSVQIDTTQGRFVQSLGDMKYRVLSSGPLLRILSYPAAPLKNPAKGKISPHLALRAWVWDYPSLGTQQVVATLENTWASTTVGNAPTLNIKFLLDGKPVYAQSDVTIWRWSRTRPVRIWTGVKVSDHAARNLAYLRSTGAVPNFASDSRVSAKTLRAFQARYGKSPHGLMGHTLVQPYMPMTGGRGDIGPIPQWDTFALLTNARLALTLSREVDDSSAVWPIHLRSKETLNPLSIARFPRASTLSAVLGSNIDGNPVPCWQHDCRKRYPKTGIPLAPNVAHEPAMNYVPYLLTADPYYLEELEFWNNWNALSLNPNYRRGGEVIFLSGHPQVRAAAWQLRTLGYLLFVLPRHGDEHRFWSKVLEDNRRFVIAHWIEKQPFREPIISGTQGGYNRSHGAMSPWQQDFLTWSFANLVRMGHRNWLPILKWNAAFVVHRLTDPGVCPEAATLYRVKLFERDGRPVGAWPDMLRAAVADRHYGLAPDLLSLPCRSQALAKALRVPKPGDFYGYPWSPQGFPANMQPALAAAVDAGVPGADKAWAVYQRRPTKQDYDGYPNWNIVPLPNGLP